MNLFLNNRQARLLKVICDHELRMLSDRLEAIELNADDEDPDQIMDIRIEVSDLKAITKKLSKHGIVDELTH